MKEFQIVKLRWELKVMKKYLKWFKLMNILWIRLFRIEENKAEFVTTIIDLLDIYNEDGDGNWLFRAIRKINQWNTRSS